MRHLKTCPKCLCSWWLASRGFDVEMTEGPVCFTNQKFSSPPACFEGRQEEGELLLMLSRHKCSYYTEMPCLRICSWKCISDENYCPIFVALKKEKRKKADTSSLKKIMIFIQSFLKVILLEWLQKAWKFSLFALIPSLKSGRQVSGKNKDMGKILR